MSVRLLEAKSYFCLRYLYNVGRSKVMGRGIYPSIPVNAVSDGTTPSASREAQIIIFKEKSSLVASNTDRRS